MDIAMKFDRYRYDHHNQNIFCAEYNAGHAQGQKLR